MISPHNIVKRALTCELTKWKFTCQIFKKLCHILSKINNELLSNFQIFIFIFDPAQDSNIYK